MGKRRRIIRLGLGLALLLAVGSPAAANAAQGTITTVAGNGSFGLSGDGGPATLAQLDSVADLAATPDGGFLIADSANNRIRKISARGVITTVAGTTAGFGGDGGPAILAKLQSPYGVAAAADGAFLIADSGNNRVRRVSRTGTITTVAGNGMPGSGGDGGPAILAQIYGPEDIAPTSDGGFLISDYQNNRIRRVSPQGTITRVAGTISGLSGDGGPATSAQFSSPAALAQTPDGGFLLADVGNSRIRQVSPAGTITTAAGSSGGLGGDGGPATAAMLANPHGLALTQDGGFLIADTGNNRIRRVSPTGTIATVAGTSQGFGGDGGPATSAKLDLPQAVAVMPDGGYLIADYNNDRIRRVFGAPAPATCGPGKFFVHLGTAAADSQKGTLLRDATIGLGGQDKQMGRGGRDCLVGGAGGDQQNGAGGKDLVLGGGGNDDLAGAGRADKLRGQAGRDLLAGGEDNDTLAGGGDNDLLDGGPGRDKLDCGGGRLDIATAGRGDTVSHCEFVKH